MIAAPTGKYICEESLDKVASGSRLVIAISDRKVAQKCILKKNFGDFFEN